MKYDWKLTIKKGAQYLLFYGLPWAILEYLKYHPEVGGLTVGTLFVMLANWLKHRK